MLDSYIIEEIKKEEERRRHEADRPRLGIDRPDGIPIRRPPEEEEEREPDEDDTDRIVRIELR